MRIIPSGFRVLAERRPVQAVAGILLPDDFQSAHTFHVLDVGDGLRMDDGTILPVPFKAGDEIVMVPGGCVALPPELYGGKQYVLVDVGAIVCKVERKTPLDGIGTESRKLVVGRAV